MANVDVNPVPPKVVLVQEGMAVKSDLTVSTNRMESKFATLAGVVPVVDWVWDYVCS